MEIWKDIVGYEGLYQVSSLGRIKSLNWKRETILKEAINQWGHKRICLSKNNKRMNFFVHRLVAEAFVSNPKRLPCINHIDGEPTNNHVLNLEWCDQKHNVNHAYDNDLTTCNKKITLLNLDTKETIHFRSKKQASIFLGKYPTYLTYHLSKGKKFLCGYEVLTEENETNR